MLKLIEEYGIIEVGIPKIYYKFKSKKNLINHINIEVNKFLKTVTNINNIDIYKTDFWANPDSIKINNFDYACHNKRKRNKTHDVYRFFDFTILGLTNEEKDRFYLLDYKYKKKEHQTKYGKIIINIVFSGEGIYTKRA